MCDDLLVSKHFFGNRFKGFTEFDVQSWDPVGVYVLCQGRF